MIESEGKPFANSNPLKIYALLRDFDVADSAEFFGLPQDIPVELANSEFWINYEGNTPISGRLLFNAESSSSKVALLNAEINYLKDESLSVFSSDRFYVAERTDDGEIKEFNSYFKVVRQQQEDIVNWKNAINSTVKLLKENMILNIGQVLNY